MCLLLRVVCEVVELGLARERGHAHELPVALANGAPDGLDVDEDLLVGRGFSFGQGGPDVLAVERMILGPLSAGERQQRGHDVHHVDRFVDHGRLELARPVDERRNPNAALVKRAFPRTEMAIGRRRLLAKAHAAALLAVLRGAGARGEQRTGRAAVVAREQDDRVVAQPLLFKCGDNAADLIVQRRDHAGIGPPLLILDRGVTVAVLLGHLVGRVGGQRGEVEEERLRWDPGPRSA